MTVKEFMNNHKTYIEVNGHKPKSDDYDLIVKRAFAQTLNRKIGGKNYSFTIYFVETK